MRSWVLSLEGKIKIYWQVFAIALLVIVALIPVHNFKPSLQRVHEGDFVNLPADVVASNIHTIAAVIGCLLCIFMEMVQLFVGEQVCQGFKNNLQKLRLASVTLALIFLLGYVAFGYGGTYPQPNPEVPRYYAGQAVGMVCEVLAIAFLAYDFILIGYIKPQASLVAITYAGDSAPTYVFPDNPVPDAGGSSFI